MARIKCKNCGKVYRYETEGCCPECGAYNRPPRREQVNADGTIYHMKNNDYMDVPHKQAKAHGSKVCFEEKECHEEKVCYENKTHSKKPHVSATPVVNQFQQRSAKKDNNPAAIFIAVACFMIVTAIFGNVMRSCSGTRYDTDYSEPYIMDASAAEDEVWVRLGNAEDVTNGWLNCINQEEEFYTVEADSWTMNDDVCYMIFTVDKECKDIESLDVSYGDGNIVNFGEITTIVDD